MRPERCPRCGGTIMEKEVTPGIFSHSCAQCGYVSHYEDDIFVCGVDIGLEGGITFRGRKNFVMGYVMPVLGKDYNLGEITQIFKKHNPKYVFIEKQQPFPKQGVKSMFSLGRGQGIIEGIVGSLGISYELVHPKTWQTYFMGKVKKTKEKAYQIAHRLFPHTRLYVERKTVRRVHTGLVDSLLIAEYGWRKVQGRLKNE